MPLSTLSINALLEQFTDEFIRNTPDFQTLRDTYLSSSPIAYVTEKIKTPLQTHLLEDITNSKSELTNKALENQIREDAEEEQRDLREKLQDETTASKVQQELQSIEQNTRLNDQNISTTKLKIAHWQGQLFSVEQQIKIIQSMPSDRTHDHGHSTQSSSHKHRHGHSNTHAHQDASTTDSHTHTHQDFPYPPDPTAGLRFQKKLCLIEIEKLVSKLGKQEEEQRAFYRRAEEIRRLLTITLPSNNKIRHVQAQARAERMAARSSSDPSLPQLSSANRSSLTRTINTNEERLRSLERSLMDEACRKSHKTYLARIQYLLPTLNLTFYEKEAMKQVFRYMKQHREVEKLVETAITQRNVIQGQKQVLESNLAQENRELERLRQHNPKLEQENKNLSAENKQLEQAIEERHHYGKKLLIASISTLVCTALAVGGGFLALSLIPIAIELIPIVFAPAAAIGLTTMGLFIGTLVSHVRKTNDSKTLTRNTARIDSNSRLISSQGEKIGSLFNDTIPKLRVEIIAVDNQLNACNQSISHLQTEAQLHLTNAKNMVPSASNDQGLFGAPPPYGDAPSLPPAYEDAPVRPTAPSAPALEEEEEAADLAFK